MVWSWVSGDPTSKEVRATRDIMPGEELTANYIDSFEVRKRQEEVGSDNQKMFAGNFSNPSREAGETEVVLSGSQLSCLKEYFPVSGDSAVSVRCAVCRGRSSGGMIPSGSS